MTELLQFLGVARYVLRLAVLAAAVIVGAAALLDWAVRTRRINPFSGAGRFARRVVDPLMAPVERRLLMAGRRADNAPWWALGIVVVGGLVLIALFDFVAGQLMRLAFASDQGAGGLLTLVVAWTFGLLQLALIVRVLSSWIRVSPYSPWVRWSYALTEWMLRPLRQLIPPIGGMIDITPIIAYFVLGLLQGVVMSAL